MAQLTPYSKKRILILDDMPEMRSSLRNQVGVLGCEEVSVCGTVKEALELVRQGVFDVILCDYFLAGGTDGQQFLEFLRTRKLIPRSTIFMMVTAEQGYENVVTAAECMPDDYLLKPFTADALRVRLERLLEKKERLAKLDAAQDKGDWPAVLVGCDEIIAAKDRYLVDALRIKGQALTELGKLAEAVTFYRQVLEMRPLPWARLGLARVLRSQGDLAACEAELTTLIAESPRLMAAYDLLGQLHAERGEHAAALDVLDSACRISPNSLARHRAIASVAEEKGDFGRVEQALTQVVKRTRHSPLRETADIARLGTALTEMGEPQKAVALLEEARVSYKDDAHDPLLAAAEAVAQHKAGNTEKAIAAIARATGAGVSHLSGPVAIAVAKACLSTGQHAAGEAVLKEVVQGNPEATHLHAQVTDVLRAHGASDRAEQLVADSIREIIELNNEAVRRANAGEVSEAAAMLTQAAQRLPGNLQIVVNAAFALFFDVYRNGLDRDKLRLAQQFQQAVIARQPDHPKLTEIAELTKRIQAKYLARK